MLCTSVYQHPCIYCHVNTDLHRMSLYAIQQYHAEVEKIVHFGGTKKETAIRNAFYNLLNEYAKGRVIGEMG